MTNRTLHFMGLVTSFFLTACSNAEHHDTHSSSTSSTDNPKAMQIDTIYENGVIWTGVAGQADASTMAVANGKIVWIGGNGRPAPTWAIQADKTIDLEGRFVMTGFIDNHVHFLEGATGLASVDLRDAKTPQEFSTRIINYASTLPKGRWVLTGNWDHENWGGELPRKEWIDAGTEDTPVFVIRIDGHMGFANSAALKLAGLDANSIAPEGGEIIRDSRGHPTGILKDNAMIPVQQAIPAPSEDELMKLIQQAQDHALSVGLTELHHVSASPLENTHLDLFRRAYERDILKIRMHVYAPLENWPNTKAFIDQHGYGDDFYRRGGTKALFDGALGSTTAWFYEPYTDHPETSGFPLMETQALRKLMYDADANGLTLAIHAIGDRAIDTVIEQMKTVGGEDIKQKRFRIEHFQHPTKDAIKMIAKHGIIASSQPYHAIDDGRWAEDRIGPERIQTTYAFRSILDAGGILTFGSDWPVALLSPLQGVYAAVTRQTTDGAYPNGWQPQEKITVEEALSAYTVANAYASFNEAHAGTLEPGKRADFIVLSDDPRKIDPIFLPKIDVQKTFINGEEVFSRQ